MKKTLRILGTRGVPAAHGGFETFAEHLSLFLVARGWRVIVYCQEDGHGPVIEDTWQCVERIRIPIADQGPKGTVLFDWKATLHAAKHRNLCLTLGYNTAVFCTLLRLKGIPNLINMDGIEWARSKWGTVARAWFWMNERAGCWLGNHLIADHPEIKAHLSTRVSKDKITVIPYGADAVGSAPSEPVLALGLQPGKYFSVIARPEPENSLLEIVRGFSRKPRGHKLAVLGNYSDDNAYHRSVKAAASDEVCFVGAIYDKAVVQALRFHSVAYVHGHQVGGTNPSLVEALGAGNAVLAHENRFNRWVAGGGAEYFCGACGFSDRMDEVLEHPSVLDAIRLHGQARFERLYTWPLVLQQYEDLLTRYLPA